MSSIRYTWKKDTGVDCFHFTSFSPWYTMDSRCYWRYRHFNVYHVPNGVHCKEKTSTTEGSRWGQGSNDDKHNFSFPWHTTICTFFTGTTRWPLPTPYSGICASSNKPTPRVPISTQFPTTLPWSGRSSSVPSSRTVVSMATEQFSSPGFCTTRESVRWLTVGNLVPALYMCHPEVSA